MRHQRCGAKRRAGRPSCGESISSCGLGRERADGGPLLYRTRYRANLWRKGERPRLEFQILEGDPRFSV